MSEKVRAGTLTSTQHQQAQLALARELAATNGYLTRSGALNTQKALAELRAAQATRDATAADAAAAAAKAKLTASYQQLLASVNPTIARQQQTKQVVDMLRAAVNAQAISVQQAAQALLQYRASLNALNGGLNQASLGLNRTGVIVQQAGYQFGDFFVQIQSGTNVMVALGQQATQLIGTFAAFATSVRTVAILSAFGVVVPILTAIGAYMMRASGSAKTLEQRVNDLTTASDRLKGTLEIITSDDMDLSAKFGDMAFAIRDTANAMRELNRASEFKTLVDTVEGFGKAVAPSWLDRITDPDTLFAGMSGVAAGGGGSAAGTTRRLEESTFQKRTGFQMGLDTYEGYIEGMRAAAVRGDVPELNRVFRQFIDDATDGSAAVDKITLAGGVLAAEMMRVNTIVAESNARYNGTAESAKRVLNFEQERVRLMERDLGAAQEIQLARAAAKFGKDSLRYRQEERAVARQSYAEQLNVQVQQSKLTVDQATNLLSIYDTTQSIVDAEDRRVDAQRRLTAAYQQYAASRSAGEDSRAAGEKMLAQMQEQTRLQVAINTYGKDSAQALAIQRAQHEAIVSEQIKQMGLADPMVSLLIAAAMELYDAERAANGLKNGLDNAGGAASVLLGRAQAIAGAFAAAAANARGIGARTEGLQAENAALQRGASLAEAKATGAAASARITLTEQIRKEFGGVVPRGAAGRIARVSEDTYNNELAFQREQELNKKLTDVFKPDKKGGGGGKGKDRDPLADLLREMEQRQKLIGMTGQQREIMEETFKLQKQLSDTSLTDDQIVKLAEKNVLLAEQERLYDRLRQTSEQVNSAFENAFVSFVTGASSAREAASNLLRSLANLWAQAAFRALVGGNSGLFSMFSPAVVASANGNAFMGGNVIPFANGGVVNSPTLFPMSGGKTGLMGEAGAEAIMPLKRGRDGKLGVASGGQQNVVVDVRVHMDENGNWQSRVERIADQRVNRAGPTMVRQAVRATYAANSEERMR
jgi:hypothetical protein